MRMRALLATVVVAASVGCEPVTPTNPYDPGTAIEEQARAALTLTVRANDLDAALEGAQVSLQGAVEVDDVATDEDGRARLTALLPGDWVVVVEHPGYLRETLTFSLYPGDAREIPLTLVSLAGFAGDEAGHVFGEVRKEAELALAEAEQDHGGAIVEVVGTGVRTVTAPDGRFDLFLRAGTYELQISAPEHATSAVPNLAVAAGEDLEVAGPVVLSANPGSLVGAVTLEGAAADGNDGVLVTVGAQTAQTAADGTFTVSGVSPGTQTLTASKAGYRTFTRADVRVEGGRTVDVGAVSLALARGRVTGQVLLSGRSDHSGVTVGLTGTTWTTVTNADGEFALEGVEVGTYELTARAEGFRHRRRRGARGERRRHRRRRRALARDAGGRFHHRGRRRLHQHARRLA